MKIKYIIGDLLASDEKLILHGTNKNNGFGSGFAKAVLDTYPEAAKVYHDHYAKHGLRMGEIIWAGCRNDVLIGHAVSQEFYGREAKRYCSYDALDDIFSSLDKMACENEIDRIALPMIGSGLANGNWAIIEKIITENAVHFLPVVYVLPQDPFSSKIGDLPASD